MRVLFTTRGSAGHLGPLVPYATACRSAGHDVLVAAQDRFEAERRADRPAVRAARRPARRGVDAAAARVRADAARRRARRMVADFFGVLDVRAMLPGLRALAGEWRPDLIVRESWEYTSPLVAEEHGIPIARVGLGVAAMQDESGEPYLTSIPSTLEDPAVSLPPQTLRFRGAEVPLAAPSEGEPLVYVSFGSVTAGGHLPFYPALYRAAIEALAPLPARFLLTVGEERDHAELGTLPHNVTVERWVPQDEVLHRAAAVVTHGGLGSTLGALAHGVPLVGAAALLARPVVQRRRGRPRGRGRRARRRAPHPPRGRPARRGHARRASGRRSSTSSPTPRPAARHRRSPTRSARCRRWRSGGPALEAHRRARQLEPAVLHERLAVGGQAAALRAGRRSCPSARPTRSCRRSPGRSGRPRGGRCRRSSRRAGSSPTGRSMPKFVPMPISPRREAPSSVASVVRRYSSPRSACASTTRPPSKRSVDPLDRHAARARRDRVADRALRRVLQRAGEDLARGHVALAVGVDPGAAVDAQPQVGALRLDAQLARAGEPLDQPRLRVVQLAPGGDRVVAVEEERALDERGEVARSRRPPAARRPASATPSRTSAAASPARSAAAARGPPAPAAPGRRPPARSCSRGP